MGGRSRDEPRPSLSAESGPAASFTVSALICTAHILFAFAQLSGTESDCPGIGNSDGCPTGLPDDGLVEVVLRADVGYDAHGALASTMGAVEDAMCGTACPAGGPANDTCSMLACDECLAVGGFNLHQRCALHVEHVVMHLSYIYMIKELYTRDASPNCYHPTDPSCTGRYPGRPATAILVASSFIWPHVKLLLLHVAFYARLAGRARRNLNYWLSFFGKWTLTDVLVWCACVAVFHGLNLDESVLTLWHKVETAGVDLCAALCANQTHLPNCTASCAAIDRALDATLLSPADLPSSSIFVRLGFNTRVGTYLFCVAVVLSLSCSVLVDALEDRSLLRLRPPRAEVAAAAGHDEGAGADANADGRADTRSDGGARPLVAQQQPQPQQPQQQPQPQPQPQQQQQHHHHQAVGAINSNVLPLLATAVPDVDSARANGHAFRMRPARRLGHSLGVTLQLWLTFSAVTLPLFRRHVGGGIPAALASRGFDFDGAFSLIDLARLAAAPGGWDYLLSATFWTFVIICPLLRGATQLMQLLLPLHRTAAVRLHRVSRALSYYYAHEVMLVGVPLLQITIGPLTSTLFTTTGTPLCGPLEQLYGEDVCFVIEVRPHSPQPQPCGIALCGPV